MAAFLVTPRGFTQDAAVEERLNRISGQLDQLEAARVRLEKELSELRKDIAGMREEMAKPNGSVASQEELRKLAEKVQEIDQKRVADNEKIYQAIEKVAKAARGGRTERPEKSGDKGGAGTSGPSTQDKNWFEYVVQSGDTISTIAMAYREKGIKVSTDQILKANHGLKPENLKVGQKIWIPAPPQ